MKADGRLVAALSGIAIGPKWTIDNNQFRNCHRDDFGTSAVETPQRNLTFITGLPDASCIC